MKRLIHLVFAAYILIDLHYLRVSLFEATLPITKMIQMNYGTPGFIEFNRFMALLLKPELCALLNIFYVCMTADKYRAIKSTLFQGLSLYTLLFYKALMNDPRPYFVDSEIKGLECYADFGNPSGHAMSVWMFYGIIMRDICRDILSKCPNKQTKWIIRVAFVGVFTFLLVGIVFCRIFLGVHSINQVMMGTVFGIYIYLIYIWYAEMLIEKLYDFIRSNRYTLLQKVLSLTFILALLIELPVKLYNVFDQETPPHWRENVLLSCPHFEDHNMFYKVCFKACATIATAFGPLFALILHKRSKNMVLVNFKDETYHMEYSVFSLKTLAKAIIGTSLFLFVFVLFYKLYPVSKFFPSIPVIYDKYYSMTLGCFFSTFFFTLSLPLLFVKSSHHHHHHSHHHKKTHADPSLEAKQSIPHQNLKLD